MKRDDSAKRFKLKGGLSCEITLSRGRKGKAGG